MAAILCLFGSMSLRSTTTTRIVVSAFTAPRININIPSLTVTNKSTTQTSFSSFSNIISRNNRLFHKKAFIQMSAKEEIDPGQIQGTDLRVLKYPHPSLRSPNAEITNDELSSGSISKLAKEMFLVMYATEGVGLAAPQVGINKRLMVYNESGNPKKWMSEMIMINPKIIEFSDAKDVENEGCLSFPGMRGDVERSKWIKVEATNLKGKKFKKKFVGWEARIFQHEYDHLDGILYPDRLNEEGKVEVKPRLDELIKEFGEGGSL